MSSSSSASDTQSEEETDLEPPDDEDNSRLLLEQHRVRAARKYRRPTLICLAALMGLLGSLVIGVAIVLGVTLSDSGHNQSVYDKAEALLRDNPLIDG